MKHALSTVKTKICLVCHLGDNPVICLLYKAYRRCPLFQFTTGAVTFMVSVYYILMKKIREIERF